MDGRSTRSIHADRGLAETPDVAPPLRPSTTFVEGDGRRYRRTSHATTERFEAVIGALESGHAVAYSSGMAAVAGAIDHVNPARIAIPEDCYHGVRELVERKAAQGHLVRTEPDALQEGDLWWVESPSNPHCRITDLAAVASSARARGVITACDSTFATPMLQNPLSAGIDIVMHSGTKSIAGHSDAMIGLLAVAMSSTADAMRAARILNGSVPGSLDAWLALRGVRTLALRVRQATASATAIARLASDHGIQTYYPGLESHPGHDVAASQMRGFGSMLSIDVDTAEAAGRFIADLRLFTSATSLGGVESLIEHRVRSDPTMEPGLLRMSIGIEDTDDLVADVAVALEALS